MSEHAALTFDHVEALARLELLDDSQFDALDFGAIGMDTSGLVTRYNAHESRMAGLAQQRVIGNPLFTVVAPCMNNFMVAQRFEDAAEQSAPLDTTIDYVLTLRMRPVKVHLRLLAAPGTSTRYVLIRRLA